MFNFTAGGGAYSDWQTVRGSYRSLRDLASSTCSTTPGDVSCGHTRFGEKTGTSAFPLRRSKNICTMSLWPHEPTGRKGLMVRPGLRGVQSTAEALTAFVRSRSAEVPRDAALRSSRALPFDPEVQEYGSGMSSAGYPSCLGFGVGGQSYSNFEASDPNPTEVTEHDGRPQEVSPLTL